MNQQHLIKVDGSTQILRGRHLSIPRQPLWLQPHLLIKNRITKMKIIVPNKLIFINLWWLHFHFLHKQVFPPTHTISWHHHALVLGLVITGTVFIDEKRKWFLYQYNLWTIRVVETKSKTISEVQELFSLLLSISIILSTSASQF